MSTHPTRSSSTGNRHCHIHIHSNSIYLSHSTDSDNRLLLQVLLSATILLIASILLIPPANAQSPEQTVSNTVEDLCPELKKRESILGPAQTDLLIRCGEVKRNEDNNQTFEDLTEDQKFALSQMTSEETSTMQTATVEISAQQLAAVSGRLAAIRGGAAGGWAMNLKRQEEYYLSRLFAGPGAPAEQEDPMQISNFGKLGTFFNASYAGGDRDETTREPGFDFDHWSITGGADYRLTDQIVLGGAVGYAQTETDLDDGLGDMDVDGYSVSLYGTYYMGNYFFDAIGSYARKEYESVRNINYTLSVPVQQTMTGDSDADEYTFSLGGGYEFSRGAWRYGPYVRLNYLKSEIDAYAEDLADASSTAPGSGLALQVDEQDIESFTSVLGGQVTYAFSTGFGILTPHLRLDWVHEYANDDGDITAHILNVPDDPEVTQFNTIVIPTDDPDRDYFNLGLGLSTVFPRGILGFVDYETVLGLSDVTVHQITGGIRMEF